MKNSGKKALTKLTQGLESTQDHVLLEILGLALVSTIVYLVMPLI